MTMTQTLTDPRPFYREAVTWVAGLAAGVHADQMSDPTPCDEFDVRTLLAHLLTTVRRPRAFAEGADASVTSWSDDATLDRIMCVPWGETTGRETLLGFLNETIVHGWDLAFATGQDSEAGPALVAYAQEAADRILPAEGREHVPFGAVVEPAADAGPTERLANWSGRRS